MKPERLSALLTPFAKGRTNPRARIGWFVGIGVTDGKRRVRSIAEALQAEILEPSGVVRPRGDGFLEIPEAVAVHGTLHRAVICAANRYLQDEMVGLARIFGYWPKGLARFQRSCQTILNALSVHVIGNQI